ncbi:type II toxin-antitoxin system HipA family toxin [Streptomyces sp. LaBMicrA B280]|uniref:type II toxin-antitoxin system HipA family toxin n=1 Tax=Streptomyces sp. LaBMicrA B280 TaxID=3391001 RepID=UPI003BA436FA
MIRIDEKYYAVLLHGRRIGTLCQKGDYTRFILNESYLSDTQRPVLGLRFEENLRLPYASALRLPRWFSNLLPEGPLREWVAQDRGVSLDREMELLAQVGHDLPGAVQVMPAEGPDEQWEWPDGENPDVARGHGVMSTESPWRFSLAGVALKFSMLAQGDRLTVPTGGTHGDWLVKFPDYRHPNVPRNEFAMMSLAGKVGIEVPDVRLVHRDELDGVPSRMWPNAEEWAYAVRRFDRLSDDHRSSIHIEDFAQVRDKYPQAKYEGSFETVAALAYRGRDLAALSEAVRRIAFCVIIGNGDAHLKNWSLIYRDRCLPTLSPAYDLVSTAPYAPQDEPEDLGLKFGGSKQFENVSLATFKQLQNRLEHRLGHIGISLEAIAAGTAESILFHWPNHAEVLATNPILKDRIANWISEHAATLLRSS